LPATGEPGVNLKLPELPPLSRHVPLSVAREIVASVCSAAPPGEVTVVKPRPTLPSGLRKAPPTALAARGAPHWSSMPSMS